MAVVQRLAVPQVMQLTQLPGLGWKVSLYACGPACAAMVASYLGGQPPRFDRAVLLSGGAAIAGHGTEPWQVARTIRDLAPGRLADAATTSAGTAPSVLSYALDQGIPLVTLVWPSWVATAINHYVVVTGLDRRQERVRINDPLLAAPLELPAAVFLAAWRQVRRTRPFTYVWAR